MVTEIMARENCGLLAVPRTAPVQLTRYVYTAHVLETPPHYTQHVREYLNESLPNRWLGHGGPVAWPPRSPDLTPLDYYLWGHMKTLVYVSVPPGNTHFCISHC